MDFERPIVTVDLVLMTLLEDELSVALYPRQKAPEKGRLALPGGFARVDEDASLEDVAMRTLREKAALGGLHLEQLACFSGPDRDPRGWSVSVAYVGAMPRASLEAASIPPELTPLGSPKLNDLPFDHARIVAAAADRVRSKSVYSMLPSFLVGEEFTISELLHAYQCVYGGTRIDRMSFRRKLNELKAIEPVEGKRRQIGRQRPAQVYRRASSTLSLFDRTI